MQTSNRRKTALAGLAIVLAPVLSSCGFHYATDRDYTPGVGANDRSATVDFLSVVVVSDADGKGVLIAGLANNSLDEVIKLDTLSGEEGTSFSGLTPVEVEPQGFVNLEGGAEPIQVAGDFKAGNFLPVTAKFSNGETVTLKAPVVRNCGDYAETAGLPAGDRHCPSGNDLAGNSH